MDLIEPGAQTAGSAHSLWIAEYLAAERVRAKSLIVTILGDAIAPRGKTIWLAELIALLHSFSVNERLVRTSVFRLVEEGWLQARREGRRSQYALTETGARRVEHAERRIYAPAGTAWDGKWTLLFTEAAMLASAERAELRRDLTWEGFGLLAPGVYGHPTKGLSTASELFGAQDLGARVLTFRGVCAPLEGPSGSIDALVQVAWPLAQIAESYRAFQIRFNALCALDLNEASPSEAFVLRTILIHAYRRALLHDPQLPAALLPASWPGHEAYQLCRQLYLRLLPDSDRHLDHVLVQTGARQHASPTPAAERFTEDDTPLPAAT